MFVQSTCLLNEHLRHVGSLAVSCRSKVASFRVQSSLYLEQLRTDMSQRFVHWDQHQHLMLKQWNTPLILLKSTKTTTTTANWCQLQMYENNPIHVKHTIIYQNISGSYVCSQVYSKFYTPNVCGKPMFNSAKPSVICGVLETVLEPTAVPAHWPKPRNPWWCWSSLQRHPKLEIAKLLDAIQCKLWVQKVSENQRKIQNRKQDLSLACFGWAARAQEIQAPKHQNASDPKFKTQYLVRYTLGEVLRCWMLIFVNISFRFFQDPLQYIATLNAIYWAW